MRFRISPKQEKLLGAAPIGACLDEPTRWRYEGIDEVSMHLSIGWKRVGFVIGLLFIATAAVAAAVAWLDYTAPMFPPSLFQPALARQLTEEDKQKLDLELLNESLTISGSRRFPGVEGDELRALWVEEEARTYRIADLVQQIIKLRWVRAWNNEKAFNELVRLGLEGDSSAMCMAARLHGGMHQSEDVSQWKYSREFLFVAAMEAKRRRMALTCGGLEATLYREGWAGFPKDEEGVKKAYLEGAIAGYYQHQLSKSVVHMPRGGSPSVADAEKHLCWQKVADRFSTIHTWAVCTSYTKGPLLNSDFQFIQLTEDVKKVGEKYCLTGIQPTAAQCAVLEFP